jgi:Raf kinase inhibitor-like YbhB/YbcL family protein
MTRWKARIAVFALALASIGAAALAFDVEPAAPTRCDEIVLAVTRMFTSECGWFATAAITRDGARIDVSLELHAAGDICLPVAREKTFSVPLGSLPPGEYTISVSWTDLDQLPEEKAVSVADATCPPPRGDANLDGGVDLADAVHILFWLFAGGAAPPCPPAADADADGAHGIADAVFLLKFLFLSGPAPSVLTAAEAESCLPPAPFVLSSAAFAEGEAIPARNSCDGVNLSPPLAWSGAPAGIRSFALTCLDPDAPSKTFVHWLAWDIPAAEAALAEGAKPPAQGTNGSGKVGWTGPCPPRGGGAHRYFFTLYALDAETLSLPATTGRAALEAALEGHILGTAILMGTYRRD